MTVTATAVRERSILFSGPMVRAILENRKTQTRRVLQPQPLNPVGPNYDGLWSDTNDPVTRYFGCPYGSPGAKLWVRESWAPHDESTLHNRDSSEIYYRADDEANYDSDGPWRPSIFMPRWACRLVLEVVSVRVERLNEISYADCIAEGLCDVPREDKRPSISGERPIEQYQSLWDSLNAKRGYSWESNPWVWRIEFRRTEARP